jgi:hypothetical protein
MKSALQAGALFVYDKDIQVTPKFTKNTKIDFLYMKKFWVLFIVIFVAFPLVISFPAPAVSGLREWRSDK